MRASRTAAIGGARAQVMNIIRVNKGTDRAEAVHVQRGVLRVEVPVKKSGLKCLYRYQG
jgi:hypothetical protein